MFAITFSDSNCISAIKDCFSMQRGCTLRFGDHCARTHLFALGKGSSAFVCSVSKVGRAGTGNGEGTGLGALPPGAPSDHGIGPYSWPPFPAARRRRWAPSVLFLSLWLGGQEHGASTGLCCGATVSGSVPVGSGMVPAWGTGGEPPRQVPQRGGSAAQWHMCQSRA